MTNKYMYILVCNDYMCASHLTELADRLDGKATGCTATLCQVSFAQCPRLIAIASLAQKRRKIRGSFHTSMALHHKRRLQVYQAQHREATLFLPNRTGEGTTKVHRRAGDSQDTTSGLRHATAASSIHSTVRTCTRAAIVTSLR